MITGTAPQPMNSPIVNGALLLVGVAGMWTPNPAETLWTVVLLYLTLQWFWWKQYPGILLFCLITPFIEIHTTLLEANNNHLTLNELYPITGRQTYLMSSFGLFFVLTGFRFGMRKARNTASPKFDQLQSAAKRVSQTKLILVTVLLNIGGTILYQILPWGSSLRQLATYYDSIGIATTMAFALHFWLTRQRPWLFTLVFTYLFISSFYSYFSAWKTPLIILLVSSLITLKSFKLPQLLRTSPFLVIGFILVFVWQTVKSDYREFLSDGERSQAVRVSKIEALNKFSNLALASFENETLADSNVVAATYKRAGYLEYFNATVAKVPADIPHEGGSLMSQNLTFAFIPRILAPNKGIKNDRAKVEKYTDFCFGANSFASFSLGHYCEAYIDWGPFGMMVHLFFYGVIGAVLFQVTMRRGQSINPILSFGLLWITLLPWGTFQQDMVVVAGKTAWGAFCQLTLFFPIYTFINRFITNPSN